MSTVLISFLGKARKEDNGKYRTARYRFDNGTVEETRYFGQALAKQLPLDKVILLGTQGSMWDVLMDDLGQGEEFAEDRLALIDEVDNNRVEESRLETLAPLLERKVGKPCLLRLIPFGQDEEEQTRILEVLTNEVNERDDVYLDVTHGFRHLPMLGLLSALYLRTVQGVSIQGLYYGALDMVDKNTGETPVLRLDGLLTIADWIGAIARYDQSGDYGVFASLLPNHPQIHALEHASFYERTINSTQAKEQLSTFHGWFKDAKLPFVARLFRDPLERRIAWFKGKDRAEREEQLARRYLERRDYLRAAIFGYESRVTRMTDKLKLDGSKFDERKEASESLKSESNEFRELEYLRNTMAHGIRSKAKEIDNSLNSEIKLKQKIERLFGKLLNS
ncbi:conserved hypothetical protein [Gammaproteobacteria bacterium]